MGNPANSTSPTGHPVRTTRTTRRPDLLINILIGAGDGLIIPSALVAGLTAAGSGSYSILSTGAVVTLLAALVMGIGGYYTRKNAELQPRNFVKDEMNLVGRDKTRAFFSNLGMTEEMQDNAIREMDKDDVEWKGFIDRYDLDPSTQGPAVSGMVIGIAYAVAGMLVLVPFLMAVPASRAFVFSVVISLPLLFILGLLKGRLTAQPGWLSGLKLLVTGALAITAAYMVTRIFLLH